MTEDIRIRAQIVEFRKAIEFLVMEKCSNGRYGFAKPIVMEVRDEPFIASQPPTLSLSLTAGQVLMDDLWSCGIRPTEAKGGNEVIAALKAHLADVQGEVGYHRLKESPMMEVLVAAQRNIVEAMASPKIIPERSQNGKEGN